MDVYSNLPDELAEALLEMDRNARAYGFEVGRGAPLVDEIGPSPDNPFMDLEWREEVEEVPYEKY